MDQSGTQRTSGESRTSAAGSGSSNSRHVRKLTHRQPVPRSLPRRASRWITRGSRLPFLLLALGALVPAAFLFPGYLTNSEYFELSEIRIQGNQRLGVGALRTALLEKAGVEEGVTTLGIDTAAVRAALEDIPEIASAHIVKHWPSALEIVVQERKAQGIYVSGTGTFVFDAGGYIFADASAADLRERELPILSGLSGDSPAKGSRIPKAAHQRLRDYDAVFSAAAPTIWADRSELNFETDRGVTLVMRDGARFFCGHRGPEEVGPLVEAILLAHPDESVIDEASLPSDLYATITHKPETASPIAASLASGR